MSFFVQAWIGLCKELSAYKNEPKLLIGKAASVVIFVALTIVTGATSNGNLQSAAITNAICQILLYFTPARTILFKVSTERADNFKEYLMINGMTKAAYQAKIAISNYVEIFFFAIPQTIGLYLSYQKYYTSWIVVFPLFVVLFLGGIAVVNMALYLSTLFSPKNAPPIGSMIILLVGLIYFVPTAASSTFPLYIVASLHPASAIALGLNVLFPTGGSDGSDIDWDGYNVGTAIIFLAVDTVVYLGLYLWKERERDADVKQAQKQNDKKENLSPFLNAGQAYDLELASSVFSSAIHAEKRSMASTTQFKTIEAFHMKKVYPECTAVDDISFSIFEEEIYCLLGHNGAGKTTLVNILTGLIPKTEGKFLVNGEEVQSNLNQIRGNVGFCPQKDFLLMENTVYENLSFFAEIKNIPSDRQEAEIERVMNRLGLNVHKDMPAKKLSGGFKRKLNVAIALLKDPKIIIMDEPTSGMDPVSRRIFWNIIKDLKNEKKTVILTTQFLDEAEELADRIAIMAKGKFYAVGTSDFLKKKFGTGYNLVLEKSDSSAFSSTQESEITSMVQAVIPTATRNTNAATGVLQFTLPFNEQNKFSSLFAQFENMPGVQVGLQMVSLEEAFVSLGLSLEKDDGKDETNKNDQAQIPKSFFRERKPTFGDQLKAVLVGRLYRMKRNVRVMFFSSFPVAFVIAGIAMGGSFDDQGGLSMMITMMLTGNAFLINTFTVPVSVERILKITHSLKAMGLRTLPYWIGNFIIDFGMKFVMSLIVMASVYIFNVGFLKDQIGVFMGIYLGFSFYMIILAYNFTLLFDNQLGVMIVGPALLIGGGYLPKLIGSFLSNEFGIHIEMYVYIVSFVFFGPAILLQLGMNLLVPQFADVTYLTYAPFSEPWAYIIIAFGMGILYFLRLLYADSKVFELKESKTYTEKSDDKTVDVVIDEEDVTSEKERLKSPFNKYLIKTTDVTKVYPNGFKALHDLSFGVEQGQIFCLLGPNGAGKSTAFQILTTMIPKTQGSVQLEGQDLSRDLHELFYDIGICSQTNTIWEYVTVEEHLRVYALLKGMKGAEIDESIQYLIKALKLEEYVNRESDKLSGGNKRKLCVAISMIGAPRLLFLDEPSTGMDPVARNYLWSLIKDVMKAKQGAMVLTTHYMQEAELVGDKLGILVNGRFNTMGSLSELKRRFGEYSVIIYETENGLSQSEIEKLVKSILPESRRQNTSNDKGLVFKVPSNSMKFAKTFSELENIKSMEKIKDFSIYTTTLEQIFIQLAKNQRRLTEF